MPYYDKNAILKALTKEQVIKIVTDLGSKGYRTDSSGNLIFQTICHGGDSYKLYYYHEPTDQYSGRTFHCYTSCSESFSIFELVIRAKRVQGITYTWYQAVSYIAKITNEGVKTMKVAKGDGFCQGIFLPYGITEDDKTEGTRNGGFGSTDK